MPEPRIKRAVLLGLAGCLVILLGLVVLYLLAGAGHGWAPWVPWLDHLDPTWHSQP